MLLIRLATSGLFLFLALPAAFAGASPARLIVVNESSARAADRAEARADAGVTLLNKAASRIDVVEVAPGVAVADAVADLLANQAVDTVEVDRPIAVAEWDDPFFPNQWGLENNGVFADEPSVDDADLDATEAWEITTGGGVSVAVVDTGVQHDHPDLEGQLARGWNYLDGDSDSEDDNGHGTHVAGIIAARAGNQLGIAGVANGAHVIPMRVLDWTGRGTTAAEIAAFTAAGEMGVTVVNASFGSGKYSAAEDLVIQRYPKTLFVVAAGNNGANLDGSPKYPCALNYENVLCVGASTPDDTRADFSNFGRKDVDLFAPGQDIASTWNDDGYALESGTSMAAPMVAATAALVAAANPDLAAAEIRKAILDGVDRPVALASASFTGGRVNAAGALEAARTPSVPPKVPTPPAQPRELDKSVSVAAFDSPPKIMFAGPVAALSAAWVSGRPRVAGSAANLAYRVSAASRVSIVLSRHVCRRKKCEWRQTVALSVAANAGLNRLRLSGKISTAGSWRARLSVRSRSHISSREVRFKVRR